MRLTNVKDVAGLENGEVILSMQGTITKVYDRKTGTNDNGEWSVQNAMLRDDTGEIRLSVWNQENLKPLMNKEVIVRAGKDKKGNFAGLVAKDNTWKDKTTRQVEANHSVTISQGGDTNGEAKRELVEKGLVREETHEPETNGDPMKAAREDGMRAANAFAIALGAMEYIAEQYEKDYLGKELPPEQKQAIASSIFIYLSHKGRIDTLPAKPVKHEAKQAPVPEREPVEPELVEEW